MKYELHAMTPATPGYDALVAESMAEGHRMLVRLRDNWTSRTNVFDRPGEMLVGAIFDGEIIGVCGLNIDPYCEDPRAGRVRHLYVARAHRRHGVGALLVRRIADAARGSFEYLNTRAPTEAFGFYERLGFAAIVGIDEITHRLTLPR